MRKLQKANREILIIFLLITNTFALAKWEVVASSNSLFLECEREWNVGTESIGIWSVFAADVDDDDVIEILIAAEVNQSGELRICSYNGSEIALEHSEMWQTDGNTRAWSVFAADVDNDGITEILVGSETKGQIFGQLRIWNWNGTTLTLEHSEEWQTISWTHVYSVFAADVDNDGITEVITGGDAFNGTEYNNQLRIWNWNNSVLTLEVSQEWCISSGAGVHSVYALDIDGDDIVEIVTAGQDAFNAQLRIWNWNNTALVLEHSEEWIYAWTARALSVFATDVDNDGTIEIVTGGEANDKYDSSWVNNGQLRIWNWNGSAIMLEDGVEWPLNGTYTNVWTISHGDVDRDGTTEILTAGSSGPVAQLRVWSFNGLTLTLDASQETTDDWADTVFALDVDGDGTTEILTAGQTYDPPYSYVQLKIWSIPEYTPPMITVVSPENTTYSTSSIPLTFTINESAAWIGYSLDNQLNETISGNSTLPTLLEGAHQLIIYANDTYGNMGESAIVHFTVDTTDPNITDVVQDPPTNVLPDTIVRINATITDTTSGINQVLLNYTYTNSTGTWNATINMEPSTGDVWNATIPTLPYGTNVTYTLIAEDNAGNSITTEQLGYTYKYQVVPEFPSLIILPLFMITCLAVSLIWKRLHKGITHPRL